MCIFVYYYNMEEINKLTWTFSPTTNKMGQSRHKNDLKHIVCYKSDLFAEPTIITSDLYSHTQAVFDKFQDTTNLDLSQYHLITAGDMAGNLTFGADGNPTDFYTRIQSKVKSFTIIQGNHDLPPEHSQIEELVA